MDFPVPRAPYACGLPWKGPAPRPPVRSLFPPARLPERGPAQGLRRKTFKVRHYRSPSALAFCPPSVV